MWSNVNIDHAEFVGTCMLSYIIAFHFRIEKKRGTAQFEDDVGGLESMAYVSNVNPHLVCFFSLNVHYFVVYLFLILH